MLKRNYEKNENKTKGNSIRKTFKNDKDLNYINKANNYKNNLKIFTNKKEKVIII